MSIEKAGRGVPPVQRIPPLGPDKHNREEPPKPPVKKKEEPVVQEPDKKKDEREGGIDITI